MGFFTRKRDKEHPPYETKEGYKQIYEPNSSHARDNGFAPEHIVIAEKKAKRQINQNEVVHHKDGNKKNNKPKNLQIVTKSEHWKIHNKNKTK